MHGKYNVNYEDFFHFSQITSTRGDKFKIFIEGCSSKIRSNSFVFRTVKLWNNLKFETKDADSVNSFKNSIDKELGSLMFEFD